MNEIEKKCPFRKKTQTINQCEDWKERIYIKGTLTTENFLSCLKEECVAWSSGVCTLCEVQNERD